MKRIKQHGSKLTNNNLQRWPFEPAEESQCFLSGLLEWVTEAKSLNVSYNFDLRLYVFSKHGNNSLYQTNYVSLVLYVKFWIGKHCLVKRFAFLKNVCYQYLHFVLWVTCCFFFYELLIGPHPTFLECIIIFVWSDCSTLSKWHGYSSHTLTVTHSSCSTSFHVETTSLQTGS